MLDYAAKKPFSTFCLQNNQNRIGGDRCFYNPKELVLELYCLMGLFAHIGRKHQYTAPCTRTTSILYRHYKHLVQTLQAPCTGTTSTLYWHYKQLVLVLQSILYSCYKGLVESVQITFRCAANAVALIHGWQSGVCEQLSKINSF